jgi:protein ImuA
VHAETDKRKLAKELQAKINAMQGLGKSSGEPAITGLAPFDAAFPGHIFPTAAIHEFVSYESAHAASTNGFITAFAGKIIKDGGICLWIGSEKKIFAPGLRHFGLEPDRVVFIHTTKQKDKLWIMEEALKCEELAVVVGEMKELGFTESRRLQLAVEHSGVTGFIHRVSPRFENAVACTTRWKIVPLASITDEGLPGIGNSCWDVQLLKVKNGRPDSWQVSWTGQRFLSVNTGHLSIPSLHERHAG